MMQTGEIGPLKVVVLFALMVAVIGGIVFMERAQRRVSVQYARRMVGRRMYGGASTHIPLKVNTGGVMPVIFSSSILAFPYTISKMGTPGGWLDKMGANLTQGYPLYTLIDATLIIFFAYFYTAIIFNPDDVAENMRKYGGFVPGIRPGKRTAEHIDQILARITLVGALYLVVVALFPELLTNGFKVATIPFIGEKLDAAMPTWFTSGLQVPILFGGTSLLILVGVAMDTVQQVESQLIMRHYDGFMKKTRIKGRRS
jgi:preprotein translocase subunit SecY